MRATFYKNVEALRSNFNEQRASEKKSFSIALFFFLLNYRSIVMFHISFYKYFEYLHFSYQAFFHTINILCFVSKKHAFCYYSILFRTFSSQVSSFKYTHFFRRFSWREMLVYNFFRLKFYFYWTILATWVYEGGI